MIWGVIFVTLLSHFFTKIIDNRKQTYIHTSDKSVWDSGFKPFSYLWDYSSAGEHFVDIEGVTGSIPVSPTINFKDLALLLICKLNSCHTPVTNSYIDRMVN